MKTYKTWEVIKMISENNKLKFRRTDMDTELCVYDGWLTGRFNAHLGIKGNIKLEGEWELIEEPVTFMEAINSGKKIKSEYLDAYECVEDFMDSLSEFSESFVLKVINGKWFIMEGK